MKAFIILILIQIDLIYNHICGTNKLKFKPKSIDLSSKIKNSSIKNVKSSSYTPIAIGYDFSTLSRPSSMTSTVFSNVKSLLQETRQEFSKFVQVQHEEFDLTGLKSTIMDVCALDVIGQDYPNFLIDNDIIIFPMFESLDDGVLAAAAPCIIASKTHRPYGGILYINSNLNFNIKNTKAYMKQILLHEITHILVFHPYFFEQLKMNTTSGGKSYIKTSKVLAAAKKHFGCSSFPLPGVPLEDQGGEGSVGSHWESRYMLGDYMVSTAFPDYAISDITLALFEDSGFYKVNYYSGGLFKFGENKGCDFLTKDCIVNEKATFDEFCDVKDEPKCSSSRALKSKCYIVTYLSNINSEYRYFSNPKVGGYSPANYCPVAFESSTSSDYFPNHCQHGTSSGSYGEKMGDNSFCFMSSLSTQSISATPVCYPVECDSTNKQIKVTVGSYTVTCDEGIHSVSGLYGNVQCPSYDDICASSEDTACNDIFSCFNQLAKKDNYNYETSYYDYSGATVTNDDDDDDDVLYPFATSDGNIIKDTLFLLILFCLLAL